MQITSSAVRRAGIAAASLCFLCAVPAHALTIAGLCVSLSNDCASGGSGNTASAAAASSAVSQTAFNLQSNTFGKIDERLQMLRLDRNGTGVRIGESAMRGVAAAGDAAPRHGLWGRVSAYRESQSARDVYGGYASHGDGFAVGYDYALSAADTIGLSLSYGDNHLRFEQQFTGQQSTTKSYQLSAYASHTFKYAYVNLTGGYGRQQYGLSRETPLGAATASFSGSQSGGRIDGGVPFHIGPYTTIVPQARLEYSRLQLNPYTENGGNAPLTVSSRNGERWRTTVGAQASYNTTLAGRNAEPYVNVFWNHDLKNTGIVTNASVAGTQFSSQGAPIPRDTYAAGVGSTLAISNRYVALLGYDYEAGGGYKSSAVKLIFKGVF